MKTVSAHQAGFTRKERNPQVALALDWKGLRRFRSPGTRGRSASQAPVFAAVVDAGDLQGDPLLNFAQRKDRTRLGLASLAAL